MKKGGKAVGKRRMEVEEGMKESWRRNNLSFSIMNFLPHNLLKSQTTLGQTNGDEGSPKGNDDGVQHSMEADGENRPGRVYPECPGLTNEGNGLLEMGDEKAQQTHNISPTTNQQPNQFDGMGGPVFTSISGQNYYEFIFRGSMKNAYGPNLQNPGGGDYGGGVADDAKLVGNGSKGKSKDSAETESLT